MKERTIDFHDEFLEFTHSWLEEIRLRNPVRVQYVSRVKWSQDGSFMLVCTQHLDRLIADLKPEDASRFIPESSHGFVVGRDMIGSAVPILPLFVHVPGFIDSGQPHAAVMLSEKLYQELQQEAKARSTDTISAIQSKILRQRLSGRDR